MGDRARTKCELQDALVLAWYIEVEFLAAPVSRCAHPHAIILVLGPQGGPPLIFVSEFSLSSWMEAGGNLAPLSKVHRQGSLEYAIGSPREEQPGTRVDASQNGARLLLSVPRAGASGLRSM